MKEIIYIFQIIVSLILVLLVLLQVKGTGLGGLFGGEASVLRTRRGLERLLFQFTIIISVIFLLISMLAVRVSTLE